jgi:hypothetical protein
MLGLESVITQLSGQALVIQSLVKEVPHEQAVWKPSEKEWSILEVINHLADEEQEDFYTRFDLMLHNPETPWPSIDPQTWVLERSYNTRNLGKSVERFLGERHKSLEWLNNLGDINLETLYHHPSGRKLHRSDFLASWLAHDLLHIRQLTRLHYQYLQKNFKIDYAGNW